MWFKKKEKIDYKKIRKAEFDKYNISINLKSMCLFEQLSHKSFLDISTEEDLAMILYATLVVNNKDFSNMTYGVFKCMIEDEVILMSLIKKYDKISAYVQQFQDIFDKTEDGEKGDTIHMTDIATTLIVKYGMDCRYIMYEMEMWEIAHYYKAVEALEKEKLEMQRLWTYIDIMPHVDAKKLKSPEQLIQFPWEKDNKEDKVKAEEKAAMNFLGGLKNG